MTKLRSLLSRIAASSWAPLATKAAGFGVVLVGLGLLGSGAFDRWILPRPAAAAVAGRRPPAREPTASTKAVVSVAVPSASGSFAAARASSGPSSKTSDGKLILNQATVEEIDALPGLGLAKAKAIVELRDKLGGRFKKLEELMRIRGIKRKLIERLRPLVVLDPPPA